MFVAGIEVQGQLTHEKKAGEEDQPKLWGNTEPNSATEAPSPNAAATCTVAAAPAQVPDPDPDLDTETEPECDSPPLGLSKFFPRTASQIVPCPTRL